MRRSWLLGIVALSGCGDAPTTTPPPLADVVAFGQTTSWMTHGDDPWDVFVCHVPSDTQSLVYAGLPLRSSITSDAVVVSLNDRVSSYFDTLSHGLYRPTFTAGGEVTIERTDEPQACVDQALVSSSPGAHGVLVVADAEHNADQPGGFANPGVGCPKPPCSASISRRSAYVGAADFGGEWGARPPMDLIEHELGHALFWPHSGYDEAASEPHRSALDLMSNSASPRTTNPDRRDAPDTLAINRLSAGWLPLSAVSVVPAVGATVTLAASTGTTGTRVAVVALDDDRLITVELLTATGFDDHLPADGVAVHLVEGSDNTRTQTPLVSAAPYDDLLGSGEELTSHGWQIAVGESWRVTIQPNESGRTVNG
jgi:hypothetical protein